MKRLKKIGQVIAAVLALAVASPVLASLSQAYTTVGGSVVSGSLVSLDPSTEGNIQASTRDNLDLMFGVVVPPSSTTLSVSGAGDNQVQVVTSGTANVLVSTSAGAIHVGDYITVSEVAGVGEKVGTTTTRVIGTAQSDFDGTGSDVVKRTIGEGGSSHEVTIGQIPVVVASSTFTPADGKQTYAVPGWLQAISNTVAGKTVSPLRVIIAGVILVIATISITVLLYSAVRNSLISIGRNPLSQKSILRGLLQIMGIVTGILALTAGAIYLVISR